jgi:hypothetical protein
MTKRDMTRYRKLFKKGNIVEIKYKVIVEINEIKEAQGKINKLYGGEYVR